MKQLPRLTGPFQVRKRKPDGTWWDWVTVTRRKMPAFLDHMLETLSDGQVVQVAFQDGDLAVAIKAAVIEVKDHYGATPGAELMSALLEYHLPTSVFSGIFVCKRISGSSNWSNHSWGDAVDRTASNTCPIGDIFDWSVRMTREGLWQCEQVLGSRDGVQERELRKTLGIWRESVYGSGGSHTWHVHHSVRMHTGTPPCA
jgi:hypothetical protein